MFFLCLQISSLSSPFSFHFHFIFISFFFISFFFPFPFSLFNLIFSSLIPFSFNRSLSVLFSLKRFERQTSIKNRFILIKPATKNSKPKTGEKKKFAKTSRYKLSPNRVRLILNEFSMLIKLQVMLAFHKVLLIPYSNIRKTRAS